MPLPKTLAEVEKRKAKVPPHPTQKSLTELLAWVFANDPEYGDMSEAELFVAAYGDQYNGLDAYKKARASDAENVCVRAFCLARQQKMLRDLLKPPAPVCGPAVVTPTAP